MRYGGLWKTCSGPIASPFSSDYYETQSASGDAEAQRCRTAEAQRRRENVEAR